MGGARGLSLPHSARQAADLAAFACLTELGADKPGNVSLRRGLPGLTPSDFLYSASALRSGFCARPPRTVGRMVLATIRRTRQRVKTNTNLGLALILAPLALASMRAEPRAASPRQSHPTRWKLTLAALRQQLRLILRELTLKDAREVYEAIRLAEPGGLGQMDQEDVSRHPRRDLRACMALARHRDSIAAEYASSYSLTFQTGGPTLKRHMDHGLSLREAIVTTFLTLLARRPDSLIARLRGLEVARRVSRLAAQVLKAGATRTAAGRWRLAALDRTLRASRLNPGTSADLTAAAIFVAIASER
ncbi:MAG: triphosphoribosyl-dephospho-CoA synthase [Acidobacteriota bacterium]